MKKIALILPPTVPRLLAHAGAQNALFELSEMGKLPRPHVIIGVSAGAVAGITYLPWTRNNFRIVNLIYRNLKPKNVASFSWPLEGLVFWAAITALFPLANSLFSVQNGEKISNKKFFLGSAETGISLASAAALAYVLWNRESVFDNDRLRRLLFERLDFENIFNSDILLEMIATDLKTGKEEIFTNYRQEDRSPERLVAAALASSSIVGFLPPSRIGGGIQSDGGVLTYAPLHRAIAHDVDVAVVLAYQPLDFVQQEEGPFSWSGAVLRASDITEAEVSRLTIENYNLRRRAGEKLPELLVLTTKEKLPNLSFRNFNEKDNVRAMNIGYRAIYDNLEELQKVCS